MAGSSAHSPRRRTFQNLSGAAQTTALWDDLLTGRIASPESRRPLGQFPSCRRLGAVPGGSWVRHVLGLASTSASPADGRGQGSRRNCRPRSYPPEIARRTLPDQHKERHSRRRACNRQDDNPRPKTAAEPACCPDTPVRMGDSNSHPRSRKLHTPTTPRPTDTSAFFTHPGQKQ